MNGAPLRTRESLAFFHGAVGAIADAGVRRVVLFGSYARGDYRPDSDVDLLVLVDRRTEELLDVLYEAVFDVQLRRRVRLSLNVVPAAVWRRMEEANGPLVEAIRKDGIELWTARSEAESRTT